MFLQHLDEVEEAWFENFDAHICSLLGTPMLHAGLAMGNAGVCKRALGMGAEITATELHRLHGLGFDWTETVETRYAEF